MSARPRDTKIGNLARCQARRGSSESFTIHEDSVLEATTEPLLNNLAENANERAASRIDTARRIRKATLVNLQGPQLQATPDMHTKAHSDDYNECVKKIDITSRLKKAPRRRTIYISSDDTTIVTIHPGSKWQPQVESIGESPNAVRYACQNHVPSHETSVNGSLRRQSLLVAPRRTSLVPMLSCTSNLIISDQYGSGSGKENVPPGELPVSAGSEFPLVGKLISSRNVRLPFPSEVKNRRGQGNLQRPPMRRESHISHAGTPSTLTQATPVLASSGSAQDYKIAASCNPRGTSVSCNTKSKQIKEFRKPHLYSQLPMWRPELYEDDWLAPQETVITRIINETFESCPKRSSRQALIYQIDKTAALDSYQNTSNVILYRRIQASLAYGALGVPRGRLSLCSRLEADIGLRNELVTLWLDTFEPDILATALEIVAGRSIQRLADESLQPTQSLLSNSKISRNTLDLFLRTVFFDTKAKCFHDVSPGMHQETAPPVRKWRRMVLKSFMTLLVLDRFKLGNGFSGLLFKPKALIKTTKAFLAQSARILLPFVGDIHKSMGHLGFEVVHQQLPLAEYEYHVENLAVDFRDGIKLLRLAKSSRTSDLKYPCPGRAQKIHNVRLSLDALRNQGYCDNDIKAISADDIVDGHREKTLILLTSILGHGSYAGLLNADQLRVELRRLRFRSGSLPGTRCNPDDIKSLLQQWASAVLSSYGLDPVNPLQHLVDGRFMHALRHVYAAYLSLNPANSVHSDTMRSSMECFLVVVKFPKVVINYIYPTSDVPRILSPALSLPLLAFICSRLLLITTKGRSASMIQQAWRSKGHRVLQKRKAMCFRLARDCQKVILTKMRMEKAVVQIQRRWRKYRRSHQVPQTREEINFTTGSLIVKSRENSTCEEGNSDIWLS